MHLNDHDLATYLDATDDGGSEWARDHLAQCAACAAAVGWARTTEHRIGMVLRSLDHLVRPVAFAAIEARAIRRNSECPGDASWEPATPDSGPYDFGSSRGSKARRPYRARFPWGLVALALAAGAAAATVPNSPVRQFLASWVARRAHATAAPSVPSGASDARQSPVQEAPRGLAIAPRTGQVVLVWRVSQPSSVIRVRTAEEGSSEVGRVSLLASGDGATYAVSHDTIVVDNRGAPDVVFEVDLPPPSALAGVTLLVGDHVVFRRRGSTLETRAARSNDGSYSMEVKKSD